MAFHPSTGRVSLTRFILPEIRVKGLASGYPSPTLSVDDTVVTWCSTRVNPVQALLLLPTILKQIHTKEHQIGASATLLYVDDEPANLDLFSLEFGDEIPCISRRKRFAEGLTILEENEIDILLSDERMPGMSGVEFLALAWERWPDVGRFIVSAYSDADRILRALSTSDMLTNISSNLGPKPSNLSLERRLDSQQQRKSLIRKAHILEELSATPTSSDAHLLGLDCTAACNTSLRS